MRILTENKKNVYDFFKLWYDVEADLIPKEVIARMRQAAMLVSALILAIVLCTAAGASERTENSDCAAELLLSGRGLTSTVRIRFENRTQAPLTFIIRDIALDGECTGYTDQFECPPGEQTRTVSFRRDSLDPVTSCDAGVAVLDGDGKLLYEEALTILPYGESRVKRPSIIDFPGAAVALDTDEVSLQILPADEGAGTRVLWLFNKSGQTLRLQADRILADGQLTGLSLTMQALPLTGQFAELRLPDPLPKTLTFSLAGYTAGNEKPLFRETYEYLLSAPVSVPTQIPLNTPVPQIGTVTIRKSGAVNVRESDTTESRKIGSAQAGMTYPCFGVSPAGWYLIRLDDGTEGYVTNTLTTLKRN